MHIASHGDARPRTARKSSARRPLRLMGAVAAASLLVAACGGDDDEDSGGAATSAAGAPDDGGSTGTTAQADGDAPAASGAAGGGSGDVGECTEDQVGGELTMSVLTEMTTFDPTVSGTAGALAGNERAAVFDTLMQYDPETGEYFPRMAESLESNDELTDWTLTLREGVEFGNGEPVDTEAVRWTVKRHIAEDSISLSKSFASTIESMEIVDDRTMIFHLDGPYGNFESVLAGPVGMVIHPGTFKELGAEQFGADPGGSGAGPYRVARFAPGEEIVLEAKDDYWDGPVCIETLRFVRVVGEQARYDAFSTGELDMAFFRSPTVFAQLRDDGYNLHTQIANGGFLVGINHGLGGVEHPTSDLRVRQAIAHAIDPELIDQRTFGGDGIASSAMIPEESLLYSDAIEGPAYDPERARELLDEVKAETGWDGSLVYQCHSAPEYVEQALATKALLEAVGFKVEVRNQNDLTEHLTAVLAGEYDISCYALSMNNAQPWESLIPTLTGGAASRFGYSNPDMDAAMTGLKEAATVEERQAAMVEVQKVWNETIPAAIYQHVEEGPAWHDNVEGLDFTLASITLFDEARITE